VVDDDGLVVNYANLGCRLEGARQPQAQLSTISENLDLISALAVAIAGLETHAIARSIAHRVT
jgi:hypothetical protein